MYNNKTVYFLYNNNKIKKIINNNKKNIFKICIFK